ncbi:hypothetical protein NB550_12145 [Vibrio parahaemolyticus]|jgi:DNA polymerase V|uniref:S24 family peptidase n=1 Tax=Vibrio parahaemolyticus TaxID=670 RepID=UPI00215B9E4A|nr:S24 family peptidase [Vibrio parahaemolyticus]MCR9888031.1 hypothetical protein [Vibrio parahaemolyticus]MCR9918245.1 hypothetical protein [Vibrio parahaemolyticus]WHT06147.1 hypothetical protein O2T11_24840 [Vibrio parahaemolyticus]
MKLLNFSVNATICAFTSPSTDYSERDLSIHQLLIGSSNSYTLLRVNSEHLDCNGVFNDSILVIDKALKPTHNCLVVGYLDAELVIGYYNKHQQSLCSLSGYTTELPTFSFLEFQLLGVATSVITPFVDCHIDPAPPDLDNLLVSDPNSSFVARVSGTSLEGRQVLDSDIVLVDRKLKPKHNDLIVANYNSSFVLKQLDVYNKALVSVDKDGHTKSTIIRPHDIFSIEGVITFAIRSLCPTGFNI